MNSKIIKIAKHFGEKNQRAKLYEEIHELLDAIETGYKVDIIDEVADVLIMIKQHMYFNEITDTEVEKRIAFKLNRTLKRMKEGYYEQATTQEKQSKRNKS